MTVLNVDNRPAAAAPPEKSFCQKHGNTIYDMFAIVISLVDLTTDILVLIEFYKLDRMVFFWISLSILIAAQVSYAIAFSSRYAENSVFQSCCMFICILPFTPFVSVAIYVIETHRLMDTTYNPYSVDNLNKSPLQKWMEKKIRSHLGFILEATIEAFPQSILQMVAITYFEEYTNYLAVSSILISMWSVCSKSFVFAAGTALDRYTFIFNWLCVVVDFFGLFFVISWIFYNDIIYHIFFWQFVVCIVPLSFYCMFCFWILCVHTSWEEANDNDYKCFLIWCCGWCVLAVITVFVAICFGVFTMLLQIFHWTFIALIFYKFGTNRYHFENASDAESYNKIINWINDAHKVEYKTMSISKSQNRIVRISCTNWYMMKEWDLYKPLPALAAYLSKHHMSSFQEVSYSELRENTDIPDQSVFLKAVYKGYFGLFWDKVELYNTIRTMHHRSHEDRRKQRDYLTAAIFYFPIVYLFGPLYLISRLVGLLYPMIILVDEMVNRSEVFEFDFQWVMFFIYAAGEAIILALLFGKVFRLQHIMWHILPSRSLVVPFSNDIDKANRRIKELQGTYVHMIELPMIKELLTAQFSHDITDLILVYLLEQQQPFS